MISISVLIECHKLELDVLVLLVHMHNMLGAQNVLSAQSALAHTHFTATKSNVSNNR